MDLRKRLASADIFLWTGNDAIYCWDYRTKEEKRIPYLEDGLIRIPYMPGFHDVWKNTSYYREQLKAAVPCGFLRKVRLLMVIPEDASLVETKALEDFIFVSIGRRLKPDSIVVCEKPLTMHSPLENYITVTRSCRCYSISLVRNGEVEERQFLDIHSCGKEELLQKVRHMREKYPYEVLDVYYPQMEEEEAFKSIGTAVSLPELADCLKKSWEQVRQAAHDKKKRF